jgi:hypothetical protein
MNGARRDGAKLARIGTFAGVPSFLPPPILAYGLLGSTPGANGNLPPLTIMWRIRSLPTRARFGIQLGMAAKARFKRAGAAINSRKLSYF